MSAMQLVLHAHGGLGVAAHGIHYAIVGAGVLGLVALIAPRFLAHPSAPRDQHDQRVLALRNALSHGQIDTEPHPELATGHVPAAHLDPNRVAGHEYRDRAPMLTTAERVWLPLAVVSSAAAAGVHAALAPDHFREATSFGLFFVACALLQLLWAGATAVACSRNLLLAGVLGNLVVLALWSVTRTLGLPFGLMPEPEAIGFWDLACALWELAVIGSSVAVLQSRDPVPARMGEWRHWHAALPTYVAGSVLLLVALSLTGAGT